jgi:toxin ParE1/3/4
MPRLLFAESAERDLVEIGNFIARENSVAAARFLDRLEEVCRLLASHPLIGRLRDELRAELRSFPFGRYVIFYRALADGAEIVRVLHGARDLPRAFRGN